ncbi:MAG: SseB family protein [Sulfitobacter sp.]
MEQTPIDAAHAAMTAAPEDDAARLRYYERVADGELYLLLEAEAAGDQVSPQLLETDAGQFVLGFDRATRLSAYVGGGAPYVALSGRAVVEMLEGQGLGMAINLGAPSEMLLPTSAVDWLRGTLANAPDAVSAKIEAVHPPKGLPETLITAIDEKLSTATAMAACAWLVGVTYPGGGRGHLLGFVGASPRAESALVRAASEALTFSGIEAGTMDVGFFAGTDPAVARMAKVGLRFDLPQGEGLQQTPRMPPGSDPSKPPKLK